MKTRVIEELAKTPVNRDGERVFTPNRLVVQHDESETVQAHGQDQERYRLELKFVATFVNFPGNAHEQARIHQHRAMVRSLTESIYGDLRHMLHTELMPIAADCPDWESREALMDLASRLLEMTRPE